MITRPISSIVVGLRHRRDLGNIYGLAASITDIGLLHPIVVTPEGTLIAGERRLEACKLAGLKAIPVHVVNIDAIVRGEFAENTHRKDFTLSEAVAIKRALEPLERAEAEKRMRAGKPSENFSEGNALDKIAAVVGKHRTTIAKAEAVVDAATLEPEKYSALIEAMDRTGKVNGPYRRLRNMQQAEAIRAEPPPLPNRGLYRAANSDVPWPYEVDDDDPAHRGAWPFPTMSIDELCALPVSSIMHPDSIMWFWTTNFHMQHAFRILDAWGFEKTPTILTWAKNRFGNGHWLRGQTEHCILAVRGKPTITLTNQTTLLYAATTGHSRKPREFYDLVESLCPAPRYADLFSRYRHNDKWDCHGDEAPAMEAAP
jgi:ParB/RepB/Spo0J family partition protein